MNVNKKMYDFSTCVKLGDRLRFDAVPDHDLDRHQNGNSDPDWHQHD